jgi:hypothetical protein
LGENEQPCHPFNVYAPTLGAVSGRDEGINGEGQAGAIYRYYRGESGHFSQSPPNASAFPPMEPAPISATRVGKIMRQKLARRLATMGDPTSLDFGDTSWKTQTVAVIDAAVISGMPMGRKRVACYAPTADQTIYLHFQLVPSSCPLRLNAVLHLRRRCLMGNEQPRHLSKAVDKPDTR